MEFRVNNTTIESECGSNSEQLRKVISFIQQIEADSTQTISNVAFCGSASPEGNYQKNRILARERLLALERVVRAEVDLPDSIVSYNDSYIPWGYLAERVEQSDFPQKEVILGIISREPIVGYINNQLFDNRAEVLQTLDDGAVWQQLNERYFAGMRNASVIFTTTQSAVKPLEKAMVPNISDMHKVEASATTEMAATATTVVEDDWVRHLYLNTNALGWALAILNAGVEIDLAKHWSMDVPIFYAAHDYFVPTIKFRVFAIEPEVRYWLKEDNMGFFFGAHFGVAQYNLAVNGTNRYQDHNGASPMLGGGLSVGYRCAFSKSRHWSAELILGAGVYDLHYDIFYNVPNGKLIDTQRKTYFGIDNAAVNISYRFDLKRGKR